MTEAMGHAMEQDPRRHRTGGWLALVLLLMLAGGWLRGWPIAERPLWFDEQDTWVSSVQQEYGAFFRWTNHFETAPLSFLPPKIASDALGSEAEWVLRLPSLIFGTLAIPLAFWLGRVVHSNAAGGLTALVVAFDPLMVDQSQQARMYPLLMVLTLLALGWMIVMARDPGRSMWHWTGLGATLGLIYATTQLGLAMWAGLVFASGLLVVGGWMLGQRHPKSGTLISGTAMMIVIALLTANVGVYRLVARMATERGDAEGMPLTEIARQVIVAAKDMIHLTPAGMLVFVLAGAGLVLLARRCKSSVAVLGGVAVVNLVMMVPFRRMHHFMDPRYIILIQPAVWVGLAVLPMLLPWRRLRPVMAGVVVMYAGMQAWQCMHIEGYWEQPDRYLPAMAIKSVKSGLQPGEAVAYHPRVVALLGDYYGLPTDAKLQAGLYNNNELRDDPKVPEDFAAEGTTLIMGMMNYPVRVAAAKRTSRLIAEHYGIQLDPGVLDRHVRQDHVAVLRLDGRTRTATLWSRGVQGEQPMESAGVSSGRREMTTSNEARWTGGPGR